VYRIEWYLFGLHSYWPYQLVCVLSHLTVALLARTVMRRAGVRPWTAVALPLVFFGAGAENITYAFQINFNAALAFGLIHLLLARSRRSCRPAGWVGAGGGVPRADVFRHRCDDGRRRRPGDAAAAGLARGDAAHGTARGGLSGVVLRYRP